MKLVLVLLMLASTACMKLEGTLKVDQHLMYKKNDRTLVLLAGDYAAKASIKEDKISMKLKGQFENHRMTLNFPKGTVLPSDQGTIVFTAEQLAQPFAVQGKVTTTFERSETVSTTERCSYDVGMHCDPGYYDGRYSGPYSRCHSPTVWGTRDVRYYTKTTTKALTLNLVQEETVKATLVSADPKTVKVYEFIGHCDL